MEHAQQGIGSEPESTASKAIETLQHEASELTQAAKRASSEMLEQRVDKVFTFIDDIESAVRAAARELQTEQHPVLARYIDRAADEVAHARSRFSATDVNGLISQAENLARTRPVAALGLAFAAGFAFVRLLKSSTPELSSSRGGAGYRGYGDDDDDAAFDVIGSGRSSYGSQSSVRGYGAQSSGQRYGSESSGQAYRDESQASRRGSQSSGQDYGSQSGQRSGSQSSQGSQTSARGYGSQSGSESKSGQSGSQGSTASPRYPGAESQQRRSDSDTGRDDE